MLLVQPPLEIFDMKITIECYGVRVEVHGLGVILALLSVFLLTIAVTLALLS